MSLERIEPLLPQAPIRQQPGIELGKRRGIERIYATLAVRPRADQSSVSQDAQVLGRTRLRETDQPDELADGARLLEQQREHSAAMWIGERGPSRDHLVI